MSTIGSLRDAIQVRLATITGLHAHDLWPSPIITPAAMVMPANVGLDAVFSGEQFDGFDVVVAVQAANLRIAQDAMDPYISRSGTSSIQVALEGDKTLGGAAQFLIFDGVQEYGISEIDDVPYLIARIGIRVWH